MEMYLPPAFYYPKALTNGSRQLPPPPLRPPEEARHRPFFENGAQAGPPSSVANARPSIRQSTLTANALASSSPQPLQFLFGYHTLPATTGGSTASSTLQSPVTPEPNAFDRDMKLLKKKGQTIELIDKAGRKLGLYSPSFISFGMYKLNRGDSPSMTIFAAKVYYHRFATLTGLQNTRTFVLLFNKVGKVLRVLMWGKIKDVATACLFTASKSEETLKKLHYILNAMHAILDPTKPEIDPESQVPFFIFLFFD